MTASELQEAHITNIDEMLIASRGNQTHVAKVLGLNRGSLRTYMKNKVKHIIVIKDGNYELYVLGGRANYWG